MPVPSQSEFLKPFLSILSNGQSPTRSQMFFKRSKHFEISQEEAQAMCGSQFTLVSRVAWCDVHFVKAGFVGKRQNSADSMQDQFRITPLGVWELERSGDSCHSPGPCRNRRVRQPGCSSSRQSFSLTATP